MPSGLKNRSVSHEKAIFGRLGGEEFCIAFTKLHFAQVSKIAEQIRLEIQNTVLNIENKSRYSILNGIENHLLNFSSLKLIVDIAAGADDSALIFSMACDRVVVVIVGEPTSFIDSYALIKALYAKSSFKNYCIAVNQVDDDQHGKDLFKKFQSITSKFLDVNLHFVGSIKNSKKISKSIIERKPITVSEPKSEISQNFLKIAKNITETPINEWGGLTFLSQKKRA